eukprot:TRINITY_DN2679_c0_g1_i1.p1 TRINITY_DN2679_c0_g1~~TRINITY_DN2679_c0_g1_i1.p1  ORF type:complete len:303 (-),score=55.37 TRINITY_DN2679_c0_g1_i1:329-1237(-)
MFVCFIVFSSTFFNKQYFCPFFRNKVRIVKGGSIAFLVGFLQSENPLLRESATASILTLSASPINKAVIGESGAIPLLVRILSSGSFQAKVDAIRALYNLSTRPENLPAIFAAEAAGPMVRLLKGSKKSSKFAERATALLESLAPSADARNVVVSEGGILALVEVVEDGSLQAKEHAVGALLGICESSRCKYREAILKEGAIPGLLQLTVEGTVRARRDAETLLKLLRESRSSQRPIPLSAVIESIVCHLAAHVDVEGAERSSETAKKLLIEMVQRTMEKSMRHLQHKNPHCIPTDMSASKI